ncbi:hypothetical protein INT47_002431 [Mucor saturninus]|uniref:Uncharacterized protein n=1 Tax=Mucor saturninus TaxID=64648 RepID=A0A8H7VDH5_9FUNG|nr:hypothetical protein INT47_002431 [Mucor saturninus]
MIDLSEQLMMEKGASSSYPACPEETTVNEFHIWQALVRQNRTSAIYSVRGIFGFSVYKNDIHEIVLGSSALWLPYALFGTGLVKWFLYLSYTEGHYKKRHLSEKRPHEGDQVILAHKKQCFSILTSVHNTTLYGPKFKSTDIERLTPFVHLAIESNQDISEEDAHIIQDNLDRRQKLKTLSQYIHELKTFEQCNVLVSLIRECLAQNNAHEIPLLVWTRAVEESNSTNQKRFHRLRPYSSISMTNFSIYNFNVYIQSRSTGLIDMRTWMKDRTGYADGIGYTGRDERLLMEASSGGLEEDIGYTVVFRYDLFSKSFK